MYPSDDPNHSDHPDLPLRELCFDFRAGLIDRRQFHALLQSNLRRRMDSHQVLIRCTDPGVAPLLDRIGALGWLVESAGEQRWLHAALSHNGRTIGVLSCMREASDAAWTAVDGVALRRQASTLTSASVCPTKQRPQLFEEEEGVFQ
ncbi:MAG: hypothetical protein JO006_03720 [Paucibacter sp.]|nr:hypothetical protein [Roseateles sp.]